MSNSIIKPSIFAKAYLKNRTIENPSTGCWEWQKSTDKSGYGIIKHRFWGSVWLYTHRAMWHACYGDIKKGRVVMHKCDNPRCCNPAHLMLGTQSDNIQDMLSKDRSKSAKLTVEQVRSIKDLLATNKSRGEIADLFGVSISTIALINSKKIWQHIH